VLADIAENDLENLFELFIKLAPYVRFMFFLRETLG